MDDDLSTLFRLIWEDHETRAVGESRRADVDALELDLGVTRPGDTAAAAPRAV